MEYPLPHSRANASKGASGWQFCSHVPAALPKMSVQSLPVYRSTPAGNFQSLGHRIRLQEQVEKGRAKMSTWQLSVQPGEGCEGALQGVFLRLGKRGQAQAQRCGVPGAEAGEFLPPRHKHRQEDCSEGEVGACPFQRREDHWWRTDGACCPNSLKAKCERVPRHWWSTDAGTSAQFRTDKQEQEHPFATTSMGLWDTNRFNIRFRPAFEYELLHTNTYFSNVSCTLSVKNN